MSDQTISAHMLVKNEQNWVWYSIMSVIDFVDELLVWDTGSTDNTVEVIKTINNSKIKFAQMGESNPVSFTKLRQRMIDETKSDWILVVDGDEVWDKSAGSQFRSLINEDKYDYLINRYYNLVGDIYHYQPESAGRYVIGKYAGHYSIRAVNRRISGLHFDHPYGAEGFFDAAESSIQDNTGLSSALIETPYLHMTHLLRSTADAEVMQRSAKYKYELGLAFSPDYIYPLPLYLPQPSLVPSPWTHRDLRYTLNAAWQTPLKMLKRKML